MPHNLPPIDAHRHRNRIITLIVAHIVAALAVAAAFLLRSVIDALPVRGFSGCIMHDFLHIYCPLCGGTRAMVALFRGQVWQSLQDHPLSLYLAVGFLIFDVRAIGRTARRDPRPALFIPRAWWITAIVIAGLVFVLRNVAMIAFDLDPLGDLGHYWA